MPILRGLDEAGIFAERIDPVTKHVVNKKPRIQVGNIRRLSGNMLKSNVVWSILKLSMKHNQLDLQNLCWNDVLEAEEASGPVMWDEVDS